MWTLFFVIVFNLLDSFVLVCYVMEKTDIYLNVNIK